MRNNKLAALFPGGGAHYKGMGKYFYEQYPVFRDTFGAAGDALGMDLAGICFEMEEAELAGMNYSQIAIYTVSVGMYRVFAQTYGITPDIMAGHSLGEYSALACAGAIGFTDGLRMVQKRGELLHRMGVTHAGRMLAVNGLDLLQCEALVSALQETGAAVYISNYNSPEQFILSGNSAGIEQVAAAVTAAGAQAKLLSIPTCSHCPLMIDAVPEFEAFLNAFDFATPLIPVVANISGNAYRSGAEIRAALVQHLVRPVKWEKTVHHMVAAGVELFVETGPQTILKRLLQYIAIKPAVVAFDDAADRCWLQPWFEQHRSPRIQDFIDRCITATLSCPIQQEDNHTALHAAYSRMAAYKQQLHQESASEQEVRRQGHLYVDQILELKGIAPAQREKIITALWI